VAVPYDGPAGQLIEIWNVTTTQLTTTMRDVVLAPSSIVFSPDGATFVSTHGTGHIRLWDAVTGKPTAVLASDHEVTYRAEFSRDGRRLVTGSASPNKYDPVPAAVQVWDLASRTVTRQVEGYRDGGISPDGTMLALTGLDGTLRLCDLDTGAVTPITTDRLGWSATFLSNTMLVRTMQDNRGGPQLWNPVNRRTAGALAGHGPVAVHRDSGRVALLSDDRRTIRLWTAYPAAS
jgi:WD40 repeat protein